MPRRSGVPKREVLPDPVYNSTVVTKVVNQIMLDGKKGIAQEIVYGAFDTIKEKMNLDPMEVFNQAINNIMPVLEVKARRVGGSNYQVPMAGALRQKEKRKTNVPEACGRAYGRLQQSGRSLQKEGRRAQNGGSQQSVCTLSLVTGEKTGGKNISFARGA